MYLSNKLKNARQEKKLTQKELASLLTEKGFKTSHATISNWELDISRPDIDTLRMICTILDKDGNYFFGNNLLNNEIVLDLSDLTKDEIKELENFKEFIKNRKKNNPSQD